MPMGGAAAPPPSPRLRYCTGAGAYLEGTHWAMVPTLDRQDNIISIEQYTKSQHAPPPFCNLGRKYERTSGQNLVEDLFIFGLHLILAR